MQTNATYAIIIKGEWIVSSLLGRDIPLQKATEHGLSLPAKMGLTELDVTARNCQIVSNFKFQKCQIVSK